jgi:Cu-processing system permease protein
MSVRRIGLVAWHVFKEGVRDRLVFSLVGFAILLVGVSLLLGQITAGQDLKIIKDLGLAAIEFAGLLMAVLIGVGLVAREIDRRSVYGLLARPLRRWEFVLGKYAGLLLTLIVNVALMTMALYAVLAWIGWTSPEMVRLSWEAPAADPAMLSAVVLILGELAVMTAVALFFSAFSSNALWSTVFSFGVFIAGWSSGQLRELAATMGSRATMIVADVLGVILPSFSAFDIKAQVVHGQHVPGMFVAMTLGYATVYIAALLAATIAIFSRREFR